MHGDVLHHIQAWKKVFTTYVLSVYKEGSTIMFLEYLAHDRVNVLTAASRST